jgi:hypothetical protein
MRGKILVCESSLFRLALHCRPDPPARFLVWLRLGVLLIRIEWSHFRATHVANGRPNSREPSSLELHLNTVHFGASRIPESIREE